jgi:predicted DNA binding CopG/RHH family protein
MLIARRKCGNIKINSDKSLNLPTFAGNYKMQNNLITKFLEPTHLTKTAVKIEFKKRNAIIGIFVSSPDYEDLKAKNFWRIVSETHIPEWKKTSDNKLAKIYSGSDFTRLTVAKEKQSI